MLYTLRLSVSVYSAPGSAVYGVNTTDVTATSISLEWLEPVDAYGEILEYIVHYECDADCEGCDNSSDISIPCHGQVCTQETFTDLNEYSTYRFTITAYNAANDPGDSAVTHDESTLVAGRETAPSHMTRAP